MSKPIELQKFSQQGLDTYVKGIGEWSKGWQTLAAEMTDYTKRSFEDGTAAFEKMLSAKSIEQAVEIQSSYARRAYDDYMAQMTKIGSLYAGIAKDAYRPFEKIVGPRF